MALLEPMSNLQAPTHSIRLRSMLNSYLLWAGHLCWTSRLGTTSASTGSKSMRKCKSSSGFPSANRVHGSANMPPACRILSHVQVK